MACPNEPCDVYERISCRIDGTQELTWNGRSEMDHTGLVSLAKKLNIFEGLLPAFRFPHMRAHRSVFQDYPYLFEVMDQMTSLPKCFAAPPKTTPQGAR